MVSELNLPYNNEAEVSLLSCIMQDGGILPKLKIEHEDFYSTEHQWMFKYLTEMKGQVIDMITLSSHIGQHTDRVGGISKIAEIAGYVYTTVGWEQYEQIIAKHSMQRRVIKECYVISMQGENLDIDQAKISLLKACKNTGKREIPIVSMEEVARRMLIRVDHQIENPEHIIGVPSGFLEVDSHTGGFMKGEVTVIAGRPAMGKTAFAWNSVVNTADAENPVGVFSLEMTEEQTAVRYLSSMGEIDNTIIRTGNLKQQYAKITRVLGNMSTLPIYHVFRSGLTVEDIYEQTEYMVEMYGVKMVVIDYVQLVKPTKGIMNREGQVSHVSNTLKTMAKNLDIPVIVLAQLNRGVESRENKRPMLSDLRESGAIEQDSDVVIFLYRDEYYNRDSQDKGIAEVLFAKGRMFKTGMKKLGWEGQFTKFKDIIGG